MMSTDKEGFHTKKELEPWSTKHILAGLFPVICLILLAIFGAIVYSLPNEEFPLIEETTSRRPNIVLILMDDLGYSDIGYNGGYIPTPNIDALAADGIRLNYNYVEFVCSATRSSLLTGRYAHHTGLNDGIATWNDDGVDNNITFIAQILSDNDYDTLMFGKWHLGGASRDQLPSAKGFGETLYFKNAAIDYYSHLKCWEWDIMKRSATVSGGMNESLLNTLFTTYPDGFCGYDLWRNDVSYWSQDEGEYIEDILSDEILDYLDDYIDEEREDPFFIYWAMSTAHDPIKEAPSTSTICNELYNGTETRETYCNMVYYGDTVIGDVISSLKDKELYDNTVIIFVSDNGGSALPLRGNKLSPFEGGIRTAAVIGGGYINDTLAITNCDYNHLFHVSDYYPLIMAFTQTQIDDDIDGINLLPNIKNECNDNDVESVKREQFISIRVCNLFNHRIQRGIVRNKEYKLIVNPDDMTCDASPNPLDELTFLKYWIDYDGSVKMIPDIGVYDEYNSAVDNDIYSSSYFERNEINIGPYSFESNDIYLFDINNDNIEVNNIAQNNIEIVKQLYDALLAQLPLYNGGGGNLYPDKDAVISFIHSYDCDDGIFTYITYRNNINYTNINQSWNNIWQQYIDKPKDCTS